MPTYVLDARTGSLERNDSPFDIAQRRSESELAADASCKSDSVATHSQSVTEDSATKDKALRISSIDALARCMRDSALGG